MTKQELKKINIAIFTYLTHYLYSKTDFNRDFLKLVKELGLFEEVIKDFILSLSKEDKKLLLEILTRDKEKWCKLNNYLYYYCFSLTNKL